MSALFSTDLPLPVVARGKVRDVYDAGAGRLLMVATDRLSAFDVVFPDPIPGKGAVLNQLAAWWFAQTAHLVPNHLITAEPDFAALGLTAAQAAPLAGRCSLVRRTRPLPVEAVVRGYLDGSAWKDYQAAGEVSGVLLPAGLARRQKLPAAIFTPSTKAEAGHDEPIAFDRVAELVGVELAERIRFHALELYALAFERLAPLGITLGDTKFEFGVAEDGGEGTLLLIDEALTPDSSRFWEASTYHPGPHEARSFDKQFVRDHVERVGWDKKPPAPSLPPDVIDGTTARYADIFARITGRRIAGLSDTMPDTPPGDPAP